MDVSVRLRDGFQKKGPLKKFLELQRGRLQNGRRSHGEWGEAARLARAAYRAASTNSESPYWRSGVVLPRDPLELFGMPLQIVRSAPSHGGHPDDRWKYQCFHLIIMGVALDVQLLHIGSS